VAATATAPASGERREAYPRLRRIATRWHDNDIYGHVNNVQFYAFFDTVINAWLIEEGGLDIHAGKAIGLCVESHCRFDAPLAFPEPVEAGLRVAHVGRSSVRYELGLFRVGVAAPAAAGWFVHVFVDRATREPAPIPAAIRDALAPLTAHAADP
jgi:acyl-CoA thioester hydrolase